MNRIARIALVASVGCPMPVMAQSATDFARLTALVQAQQAQIEELEARLDAVEHGSGDAVATAPEALTSGGKRPAAALGSALASEAHPPSLDARLARIEAAQQNSVSVDWSKGTPEFASADGSITFRPRGRILIDLGTTTGARTPARNLTATQARSLRLGLEGSVGTNLSYVLEGDFADNEVAVKSAYLAWTTRLLDKQVELAFGNRLNDRGLDGSSGTISVPFMERNLVAQAIIPVRGFFGLGAAARVYGRTWHLGMQVTGDDISSPGTANDSLTVAARAHWNPVKTKNLIVHLGGWGFYERLSGDVTRPTRSVAIGGFFNDNLRISAGTLSNPTKGYGYGGELAAIRTSLWVSGEYGRRVVQTRTGIATDQYAWALAGGWFLTGDTPPYLARGGVWSRPQVRHPFTEGGSGAIELAMRYEGVDYSDNPTAGKGTALTVGLNWYLNNFTRLQLNAIDWHANNPEVDGSRHSDHGQTLVGRAQIAF